MAPECLKPFSVTIAVRQICTIPCREIEDDVSIFVDGDLKCPLSRSVARLDLQPTLEVMTYPI